MLDARILVTVHGELVPRQQGGARKIVVSNLVLRRHLPTDAVLSEGGSGGGDGPSGRDFPLLAITHQMIIRSP
jgi:hypothetical protein